MPATTLPAAQAPANVLIVEDNESYAKTVIAPHFANWPCQLAYNVPQSLQALDEIVDLKLALVDLEIPGGRVDVQVSLGAGFEVVEEISKRFTTARIVILTGHLTPKLVNKAQTFGAEYVAKGECAGNLKSIAESLQRADQNSHAHPAVRVARAQAADNGLTEKQTQVLVLAVRGFSRAEIAKELDIAEWTLKSHIREIVRRTHHDRLAPLIRAIHRTAQSM